MSCLGEHYNRLVAVAGIRLPDADEELRQRSSPLALSPFWIGLQPVQSAAAACPTHRLRPLPRRRPACTGQPTTAPCRRSPRNRPAAHAYTLGLASYDEIVGTPGCRHVEKAGELTLLLERILRGWLQVIVDSAAPLDGATGHEDLLRRQEGILSVRRIQVGGQFPVARSRRDEVMHQQLAVVIVGLNRNRTVGNIRGDLRAWCETDDPHLLICGNLVMQFAEILLCQRRVPARS